MTPFNIAASCGGEYFGPEDVGGREVTAVTTDSRKTPSGSLFVPIKGERADGHDYIEQALKGGASVVLTEREPGDYPCVRVDDTSLAIQKIAGFYRRELGIPVVGITGSVGKTSTKELVAAVLQKKYRTLKTKGNFNNNLGLPLTVFSISDEDEMAVLEMGISHFGEMELLAETALPDAMVITNIGDCHLEALGDRDGVFRAKTACFEHLREGGTVFLNGEDSHLAAVKEAGGKRPVFFGRDPKFDVYAEDICGKGLLGTSFTLCVGGEKKRVMLGVAGDHMVLNALAAAAVGHHFGLTLDEIASGIEEYEPLPGRFRVLKREKLTVIDDAYNANPVSMRASLAALASADGRKAAVIGDMGELGTDEEKLHFELGRDAASLDIDLFIVIGELSKATVRGLEEGGAGQRTLYYKDVPTALESIEEHLREGDTVLVKASHFMGFDRIVETLAK